jgi:hypothetical protein
MKATISPARLWLLGLFALPIGAVGALAWMQHREAAALRVSAAAISAENARLKGELASLDRRRAELQRELADAQAKRAAAEAAVTPELRRRQAVLAVLPTLREKPAVEASARALARSISPSGPHGNLYFPKLFSDPHYAQLYQTWSRQQIAGRFAALFAQVGLPPAELDRLKELLVQKEMAYEEVDGIMENEAMREKKSVDRTAAMQVKMRVNRTFEDEIKQTFGDTVFAQWRGFENGTGARQELLDKLALRLSYSPAPLEDAQSAQLVTLFNTSRRGALAGGGPPSSVSDAFIAGAQAILKPEQMAGLLQLKTELDASRGGSSVMIRSATPPTTPPQPPGG